MHISSPKHDHFEFNSGRYLFLFEFIHRIRIGYWCCFPFYISPSNWFHLCSSSSFAYFIYTYILSLSFSHSYSSILLGVYYSTRWKNSIFSLFFCLVWFVGCFFICVFESSVSHPLECGKINGSNWSFCRSPKITKRRRPSQKTINESKTNVKVYSTTNRSLTRPTLDTLKNSAHQLICWFQNRMRTQ